MPWRTTGVLEERLRLLLAYRDSGQSLAALAREFGISRKTAHKFVARYVADGVAGLEDRSRAPHHQARAVAPPIRGLICQARRDHPSWGPRKLHAYLARAYPGLVLPAASTMSRLLHREGLAARHRRRRPGRWSVLPAGKAPNDRWAADFKGWFRAGNGERCQPLTITDSVSRYGLACDLLERTTLAATRIVFERVFREYGLPRVLLTDNGSPFASLGLGGLTRLSAWWVRLGIRPERITPGKPQENGRHERFHLTLQQATARPPSPTRAAQQRASTAFLHEYNHVRPHAALGNRTPADLYVSSPRRYPTRLAPLDYEPACEVRRVGHRGTIKWQGRELHVSEALCGERVGLRPTAEACWALYFGPLELGYYDERQRDLVPHLHPLWLDPAPGRPGRL